MPSNQTQIIEQAKFAYPPLGKAFERQTEKQIDILKSYKKDELKTNCRYISTKSDELFGSD